MWSREAIARLLRQAPTIVAYATILTGIYLIEQHSYLLFHSVVELFSVSVACAIFMIVWNGRSFIQNNYMFFLGLAYLFVAGFDLLHMLAYSGMGVFAERGTNLATQLWVAGRYVESVSLVLAPLLLGRRIRHVLVLAVYSLLSALLLLAIFQWGVFPVCFREGTGLTPFKEVSEYIIISILLVSFVILRQKKSWFEAKVLTWMSWSIVLTMGSEFLFALYTRPDGQINMAGHFLKLISFYLVYKALIETGMRQPHTLLYRRLKEHEAELEETRKALEQRVRERTADLSQTVENLKEEIQERMRAEQAYRHSERKYRTLIEQIPAVTYVAALDETSSTMYVSPQAESIMGFSPGDFARDPDIWIRQIHPEDRERVLAELAEIHTANSSFTSEYRFLKRDHGVIWLRDTAFIIEDEDSGSRYLQGVTYDITEARENREKALAHQEQLRALTAQLLTVEDQERRKIATALHDSVGQILAFLKIELGTMRRLELPEEAAHSLTYVCEQVEEAIRQTRSLTFDISPPELYSLGLESAVEELAQRFGAERHLECRVQGRGEFEDMSVELKSLLYRSVRELLINAAKHAQASTIQIDLWRSDDSVRIVVQDDGTGFDVSRLDSAGDSRRAAFGLFSIRERLEYVGGAFTIQSWQGRGTTVTLVAPLHTHPTPSDRSEEP